MVALDQKRNLIVAQGANVLCELQVLVASRWSEDENARLVCKWRTELEQTNLRVLGRR